MGDDQTEYMWDLWAFSSSARNPTKPPRESPGWKRAGQRQAGSRLFLKRNNERPWSTGLGCTPSQKGSWYVWVAVGSLKNGHVRPAVTVWQGFHCLPRAGCSCHCSGSTVIGKQRKASRLLLGNILLLALLHLRRISLGKRASYAHTAAPQASQLVGLVALRQGEQRHQLHAAKQEVSWRQPDDDVTLYLTPHPCCIINNATFWSAHAMPLDQLWQSHLQKPSLFKSATRQESQQLEHENSKHQDFKAQARRHSSSYYSVLGGSLEHHMKLHPFKQLFTREELWC